MIRTLLLPSVSLWECMWQSTLFAVVGLMGSILLRRRPARAHQVLLFAMMAAVMVPVLSGVVRHFNLGMFTHEVPEAVRWLEPVAMEGDALAATSSSEVEPESLESSAGSSPDIGPTGASFAWRPIAGWAWLAATVTLLGRLFYAFAVGVYLARRAQPLSGGPIVEAVGLAKARLRTAKDLQVRVHKVVRSPVIWCWGRQPVLLLPNDPSGSGRKVDWAGVISHELAHWKRRDHLSGLLAELVVCALPWHPLLWLSKRRLVSLTEQACDDWVLASGHLGEDYAESLLDFKPKNQMAFVPAVVHNSKGVAARVRRILSDACDTPQVGIRWALTLSILAIGFGFGVAFAQTRPASSESPARQNQETAKSLHQAAKDGDLEQVKKSIADGADVNATDGDAKSTPLHTAAFGDAERVRRLVTEGADVNATDRSGCTPLHLVAKWRPNVMVHVANHDDPKAMERIRKEAGILEMAELLLRNGADVNSKDDKGNTPLHYAVEGGHTKVAELLINKGAHVNARNQGGLTPIELFTGLEKQGVERLLLAHGAETPTIHLAAFLGDLGKVKQFIDEGVPVDARGRAAGEGNETPLFFAAYGGHKNVAEFLIASGADVNANTLHGVSDGQVTQLLIDHGANVNGSNNSGSPLRNAAARGAIEVMRVLLANKADAEIKDGNGQTALSISMTYRQKGSVLFLIAHGADVNTMDRWGQTPLHYVARRGWKDAAEALIAKGARLDARTTETSTKGISPLFYAVGFGHADIVELLIEKGADPANPPDGDSEWTLLDEALDANYKEVVRVLAAKGAVDLPEIHLAAYLGDLDAMKHLAERGQNLEERDKRGRTPLAFAALGGNTDVVRFLIDHNGKVDARDEKGMTPLHHAAFGDHQATVELLLAGGANVNTDSDEGTPLHMAVRSVRDPYTTDDDKTDMAELLIAKGADLNICSKTAGTPLHLAVGRVQKNMVRLLLAKGADVNAKGGEDVKGGTPLHAADFHPYGATVAEFLILGGADVNARDNGGATLLHLSAQRAWRRPHAELLVAHGANVDVTDNQGATALHYAARSGRRDMAEFLIAHGADMHVRNQEGRTPLSVAEEKGHTEIVELLRKHGAKE